MPSTDEKITALSARTSTQAAATDVFVFVDVSDTSMAASGSDRKMTALELGRTAVAQAGGTPALTLGTAGSAGTANSLVRTDATIAAFDATVPVTQAIGDAAAAGSAAVAARRDHKHAMPSFASPTVALSSAAGAGAAATLMRSDATIAAFSTGSPATQAIGDAAAKGSVNFAARLDHKHAMPAFAAPTIALSSVASSGAAATLIRSDATIAAFDATSPSTQTVGDAAVVGTAAFAARRDHKHAWPSAASLRTAAGIALAAKGSITTATAANTPSDLAVGADGYVLTADSGQAGGIKWAAPAGGGGTVPPVPVFSGGSVTWGVPNASVVAVGSGLGGANENYLHYVPVYLPSAITLTKVGVESTNSVTGNARCGVYAADTSWQPTGAALFDQTFSITAGGVYSATISISLAAGRYLIAWVHDAGFNFRWYQLANGISGVVLGNGDNVNNYRKSFSYAALPSSSNQWDDYIGSSSTGWYSPYLFQWS